MPGKRAKRHFSQLSEFERGLIIGMKTAAGRRTVLLARWIVRSVPLEIVGRSGHEKTRCRSKYEIQAPFPGTPFNTGSTLLWSSRSPDLSPVEHVWDQLKRQMPSCHSVHDLELAV
ncbi:uncharacterized protein TNCV_2333801 [Trichonephila clavipes]|nr:uncharacterized protein TNCV_2333801 [Trichonephila clavipes]